MRMYRIALILCVAAIVALSLQNARLTRHAARSEALASAYGVAYRQGVIERDQARREADEYQRQVQTFEQMLQRKTVYQRQVEAIAQDAQEEMSRHLTAERRLISSVGETVSR